MSIMYGPDAANPKSVGNPIRIDKYIKKALVEARIKLYFTPLSVPRVQPKHTGKKMKFHQYLPILDDRNVNDQGIDANGAILQVESTIEMNPNGKDEAGVSYLPYFAVGDGADNATALAAAKVVAEDVLTTLGVWDTNYATTKAALTADGWLFTEFTAVPKTGNFSGSSRDMADVTAAFPNLREEGGRVNLSFALAA